MIRPLARVALRTDSSQKAAIMQDSRQTNRVPEETTSLEVQLASLSCFMVAAVVLVGGFHRLFQVEATEIQFLLGCLLVLNLAMACLITGLLVPIAVRQLRLARSETPDQRG